jgi:UDP-N-acetylmuramoyl-tripeptide--D-alanyl-D-alanine ligase
MKELFKKIVIAILTFEAKLVLKKYKPRIVAVTGSVGKTSTKDAIYTILNKHYFVWRSKKSFNSEFGVPLTILNCPTGWTNPLIWIKNIAKGLSLIVFRHPYPQWLVLEVGADHPGDIEKLSQWLPLDIAVITRFGDVPVHVEFYESVEQVVREKSFLIQALKEDGVAVLNIDDDRIAKLAAQTQKTVLRYGKGESADMRAENDLLMYKDGKLTGIVFDLVHGDEREIVRLPQVLGRHHVYTALAALSVAQEVGVKLADAIQNVADYTVPPGRMRLLEGVKGSVIIDDTYNAAPVAVESGIETLSELETKGRKIAILGDMLELGEYTVDAHKSVGQKVAQECDMLLVVGPRARYITEGALLGGMSEKNIVEFDDARKAGKHAEIELREGDIVFVKGSQGMRMEKAVEEIMAHPENKAQSLVRQEKGVAGEIDVKC